MNRPAHIEALLSIAEPLWPDLAPTAPVGTRTRLMFVAPHAGAGTTTLAAAAGIGLATNLRRPVAVVEADLRRPGLAKLLGIAPQPGLGEVLEGRARMDQAIRSVDGCEQLKVVPAGAARAPKPGELAPDSLWAALQGVSQAAHFVLIDAPPLLEGSTARPLLSNLDGAVLVVQAGVTKKSDAKLCVSILQRAGVRVLGTVLNRFVDDLLFDFSA